MASEKGKTALITGASSGIGRDLAQIHAERGGDVIIVARSEDALKDLKKELEEKHKVKVTIIIKDLSKQEAPKELFDEVKALGIQVDYLINNAGFGGVGKYHERAWEQDLAMINLNVVALAALTRFYLPEMVQRNDGKILNVSSTASFMPGPMQATYFATKTFVQFLSNAISEEISDTDVTVTNLMPGATETKFGAVSGMDKTSMFSKTATSRSVAEDGYNGMIAGKLDVISGLPFSAKIMMAFLPFMPKKFILKTIHKMQETA